MQIIGYFLFALSLFYVFLLWQFPYEPLKKAIIQNFQEHWPANLHIERAKPAFPLNLILENIRIQAGPITVGLPDLKIDPDWLSLLGGKTRLDLMDGGRPDAFRGEYALVEGQGVLKAQAKELEMKASSGKELSLRVALSGEARFQWAGEDYEKGKGQIWFSLQKISMEAAPGNPFFPFLNLVDTIRAEVQVRDGVSHLMRLEVGGKDLNRSFQGDLVISGKGPGGLPDLGMLLQIPMK